MLTGFLPLVGFELIASIAKSDDNSLLSRGFQSFNICPEEFQNCSYLDGKTRLMFDDPQVSNTVTQASSNGKELCQFLFTCSCRFSSCIQNRHMLPAKMWLQISVHLSSPLSRLLAPKLVLIVSVAL